MFFDYFSKSSLVILVFLGFVHVFSFFRVLREFWATSLPFAGGIKSMCVCLVLSFYLYICMHICIHIHPRGYMQIVRFAFPFAGGFLFALRGWAANLPK